MVSTGSYIAGIAALAAVALSLGYSAVLLRRRLLPGWAGAPAYLVDSILGVALLIWLSQLLGAVSLLYAWTLVAASLLLVAIVAWRCGVGGASAPQAGGCGGKGSDPRADLSLHPEQRAGQGGEAPPATGPAGPRGLALLVTVGVVALVFAHWGLTAKDALDRGIFNFDSLWYHMPFAVEMAQSHSVTALHHTDTVFTNWLYPQNSELLHAVGVLLTERDTLSLFLNFGWLAVAFLAAWCIGRPYGRGHLTVIAAAILLECHTLVVREPGAAKNDLMAAALLLAAVAVLVSAWAARREEAGRAVAPEQGEGGGPVLSPGWPLVAAGLAVGMAAGTKFTVLAMAAALSVAVVALAPGGRRLAAATWWFLPALAGGGFWYLRNLIEVGNPLPHLHDLGPISLPGPDRLQTARPDFSIAHYATDTAVWREWFAPGLQDQLGVLWPLVLGAALLGIALALLRGDRLERWLGGAALFGLVAYVFTPLSAAGAEGAPVAFEINLRFAVPALLLALVLLPISLLRRRPPQPTADGTKTHAIRGFSSRRPGGGRWEWALVAALLLVLAITDRADAVVRDPDRVFAAGLAILLVLVPAGLIYARRRGASAALVAGGFAVLALAIAAIGYPVQRDYLADRFANEDPQTSIPGFDLDSAYRWARGQEDARIGLAGTTAGFLQYGFYGTDLSNEVVYLGKEGPEGSFNAIQGCGAFRAAVNEAQLDYLVTAPFLNFIETSRPVPSPEAGWLRGEEAAVDPVLRSGPVTVWRVRGRLDKGGCGPANAPLRALPDAPGAAPTAGERLAVPTAPAEAGAILASRPRIAILGDSYSAGEGAGTYLEGTDTDHNACHRSPHTYLVEAFGLPSHYLRACSGARTRDVFEAQAPLAVDAQIDQLIELRDEHGVDAVVMTLGGNDAGFSTVAMSCLVHFVSCDRRIVIEPTEAFVFKRLRALRPALESVYREIDRIVNREGAAGRAVPIFVLAYPLSTPAEKRSCEAMDGLTEDELPFLAGLLGRLNRTVHRAVEATREAGVPVFFVAETAEAFQPDHTLCDEEPYARTTKSYDTARLLPRLVDLFPQLGRRALNGLREFVHPNRAGYAATSEVLLRWSRGPEARALQRMLEEPGGATTGR